MIKQVKYPNQFFNIEIDSSILPDNPTPEEIHKLEWKYMQKHLNGYGHNPKDDSKAWHNEQTYIRLEEILDDFVNNPENSENDFLNHLQAMLQTNCELILARVRNVTEQWLTTKLILLGNSQKSKLSQNIMPKDFAIKHWSEIVKLIKQNDGAVMTAARSLCTMYNPHPNINSLTKAISRLCDIKGISRNTNY